MTLLASRSGCAAQVKAATPPTIPAPIEVPPTTSLYSSVFPRELSCGKGAVISSAGAARTTSGPVVVFSYQMSPFLSVPVTVTTPGTIAGYPAPLAGVLPAEATTIAPLSITYWSTSRYSPVKTVAPVIPHGTTRISAPLSTAHRKESNWLVHCTGHGLRSRIKTDRHDCGLWRREQYSSGDCGSMTISVIPPRASSVEAE